MNSQEIIIEAATRPDATKRTTRKNRLGGIIPGVLYSKGVSTAISISKANLPKQHSLATVIQLNLDGLQKQALMREVQVNPLNGEAIHFDFQEVSPSDKVSMHVPLNFVGLTREQEKDGTFSIRVRFLHLKGLVSKIPKSIDVDVSQLKGGQSVQLFDLNLPKDLFIYTGKGKNVALASIVKI